MSNAVHNTIAHITEVVARVTRILSNKQIKVVQKGMQVGVEYDQQGRPSVVYLPSLTDNPSPELLVAIQGFLDKEVSTLLYTDFDQRLRYKSTPRFKKGMAAAVQEIIEDARTEREMRKQFRGSASNFDKNHDFAVKEILDPMLKGAKNSQERVAALAFPGIRAACGDIAYQEYMDGKWEELGKLGGAILHYADEIQSVASTEDTFALTRKIIEKMEESDEEEQNDQGDGDGENGEGDESASAGAAATACDDEGGGAGSDSESESAGEQDGDGDDGDTPPPPQNHVDLSKVNDSAKLKNQSRARPSGHSGTSKGLAQFDEKELDEAFEEVNFDRAAANKIKTIAGTDASIPNAYLPYSRMYDYVGPLPNANQTLASYSRSTHAQKILDQVDKDSHVIQQQVQRLFMARELTRWEPGHRKGRLNPTALYRLPFGDPRVFRRKIETNGRDIAVSLVVDMSGSMHGSKIQNAVIAALMFSKVLTNLNIKHEICSFSTYSGYGGGVGLPDAANVNAMIREVYDARITAAPGTKPVAYARIVPITTYILKGYNERLKEETRRVAAMIPTSYQHLMSGNVDGESVELAGRRLLMQNEKRKVMIVMSDGCPAADGHGGHLVGHLKQVVRELSQAGVEMFGLGLEDSSVSKFYPRWAIVREADQIPTKILELTRQMVVGVK